MLFSGSDELTDSYPETRIRAGNLRGVFDIRDRIGVQRARGLDTPGSKGFRLMGSIALIPPMNQQPVSFRLTRASLRVGKQYYSEWFEHRRWQGKPQTESLLLLDEQPHAVSLAPPSFCP
jgi:hypothetical protein